MEDLAATYLSAWLSAYMVCLFMIFTAFGFHFYQILERFHSIWWCQFGGYFEVLLIVQFSGSKNSNAIVFIVL